MKNKKNNSRSKIALTYLISRIFLFPLFIAGYTLKIYDKYFSKNEKFKKKNNYNS